VIPDLAGEVIIVATIDYGLHLWTADSWEIVLAGSVLVSGTERRRLRSSWTSLNPRSRCNWRTWSERPLPSCW
jgi:hypothetical protein